MTLTNSGGTCWGAGTRADAVHVGPEDEAGGGCRLGAGVWGAGGMMSRRMLRGESPVRDAARATEIILSYSNKKTRADLAALWSLCCNSTF